MTTNSRLFKSSNAEQSSGNSDVSGAIASHAAIKSNVHGISEFGATIVDAEDASEARNTLGLGTASEAAIGDFEAAGTSLPYEEAWQLDERLFGFLPNPRVTLSFDPNTNTFTLTPDDTDFIYYRDGVKNTITGSKQVVIPGSPPANGLHFIYIDSNDGTLLHSTTPWSLSSTSTVVFVTFLEYNNSLTPKYILYPEIHPADISRGLHGYLHTTTGTRYGSGGALVNYTIKGSTDVQNVFGITQATIWDETLKATLAALAKPDGITNAYLIRYLSGSDWVWELSPVPYLYSGTYIYYNNAGALTAGSAGNYYTSYLLLTPNGFQFILGQYDYNTLSQANVESFSDINTINLPVAEFVAVIKLIWRTGSGYSQKGKCRLEQIDTIKVSSIPAITANLTASQIPVSSTPVNYTPAGANVEDHLTAIDTAIAPLTINEQSGTTYTLILSDARKFISLNNASPITLIIPPNSSVPFQIGTSITGQQLGAGQVSIAPGSGVTINSRATMRKISEQYGGISLLKTATDTWWLEGSLSS